MTYINITFHPCLDATTATFLWALSIHFVNYSQLLHARYVLRPPCPRCDLHNNTEIMNIIMRLIIFSS
jgi:hypothetical protein